MVCWLNALFSRHSSDLYRQEGQHLQAMGGEQQFSLTKMYVLCCTSPFLTLEALRHL